MQSLRWTSGTYVGFLEQLTALVVNEEGFEAAQFEYRVMFVIICVKGGLYMPYKSIVAKRVYQREYMRRRRSNIKGENQVGNDINVRPNVRPKVKGTRLRDDLRVDLPGGEAVWGYDETSRVVEPQPQAGEKVSQEGKKTETKVLSREGDGEEPVVLENIVGFRFPVRVVISTKTLVLYKIGECKILC